MCHSHLQVPLLINLCVYTSTLWTLAFDPVTLPLIQNLESHIAGDSGQSGDSSREKYPFFNLAVLFVIRGH